MGRSRITRDEMLMSMARVVALRGTCSRLQVGVVFSRGGRVISTGYNGAPAGLPHCEHYTYWGNQLYKVDGPPPTPQVDEFEEPGDYELPNWVIQVAKAARIWAIPRESKFSHEVGDESGQGVITIPQGAPESSTSCYIAEHAERNGIAFAARHGLSLEGSSMHVTHMPCLDCARSIINAGVEEVIYDQPYRIETGVALLERAGITVVDYQLETR